MVLKTLLRAKEIVNANGTLAEYLEDVALITK